VRDVDRQRPEPGQGGRADDSDTILRGLKRHS
jgi:hypothetical protein